MFSFGITEHRQLNSQVISPILRWSIFTRVSEFACNLLEADFQCTISFFAGCIGCEDDLGNFGKISQRVYPENQRDRKLKPAAENNEAPLSSDVTSDLPNGSDKTSGFLFGTKTMPGLSFSSLAASESAGFGNKTASQGKKKIML